MISEFNVGDVVACDLVIKSSSLRKTKTGKDFLAVTFTDGESAISGNIWNYDARRGPLPLSTVYHVIGVVEEYLGTKQLALQSVDKADNQDMTSFLCTYCAKPEELWVELNNWAQRIESGDLSAITNWILCTYKDEIIHSSAAKSMHHVGVGGLAYHLLDTAVTANSIRLAANAAYEMPLNFNLIIAGALLHDIGKIRTYASNGATVDMAPDGMLLEHIVAGIQIVTEAATILKLSIAYSSPVGMLLHIIASHHEKLEFGSPVTPRCAEAYIVAAADKISATMDMLNTANKQARNDTNFTEKVYPLDNREMIKQEFISNACEDQIQTVLFKGGV